MRQTGSDMSDITEFTDADIALIKDKVDTHEKKLDEHDKLINEIKVQNAVQNSDLKRIVDGVGEIKATVKNMQDKPGRRWEAIVTTVITGIAAALVVAFTIKIGLPR